MRKPALSSARDVSTFPGDNSIRFGTHEVEKFGIERDPEGSAVGRESGVIHAVLRSVPL